MSFEVVEPKFSTGSSFPSIQHYLSMYLLQYPQLVQTQVAGVVSTLDSDSGMKALTLKVSSTPLAKPVIGNGTGTTIVQPRHTSIECMKSPAFVELFTAENVKVIESEVVVAFVILLDFRFHPIAECNYSIKRLLQELRSKPRLLV